MMGIRKVLLAGLAGLALVAPAAPAFAAYPPPVATHGQGTADPSRVGIGECTTFSGGGFAPGATLAVTDNGTYVKTVHADHNGNFRTRVCFNGNARPGRHLLEASGKGANGGDRTVDASVVVQGGSESRGGSYQGGARLAHVGDPAVAGESRERSSESGGLPFTGFDALLATVAALVVLVLGSVLLMLSEVRYRRRRRRRASVA